MSRLPRPFTLLAGLAAALMALVVSPALAHDQQVSVQDNVFILPGVAVEPGNSVTWNHPQTADRHNVHFEDELFEFPLSPLIEPWTSPARTFTTPGTYQYYCEEHGGPGRQGMSGVVHVNATGRVPGAAPTASFTVSAGTATVGQSVALDASGTSDPDAGDTIVRHEWDLDGNGSYETDTGTLKTITTSLGSAGTRALKLRVTDSQGHLAEATRTVVVRAPPPPPAPTPPAPPTGQGTQSCSSLSGSRRAACVQRSCRSRRGSRRAACIRSSCRYLKRSSRPSCIRKSCRYEKRSRQRACKLKSCRTLKGAKKRACTRKYRRKR